jgi:hypothetical protein
MLCRYDPKSKRDDRARAALAVRQLAAFYKALG